MSLIKSPTEYQLEEENKQLRQQLRRIDSGMSYSILEEPKKILLNELPPTVTLHKTCSGSISEDEYGDHVIVQARTPEYNIAHYVSKPELMKGRAKEMITLIFHNLQLRMMRDLP